MFKRFIVLLFAGVMIYGAFTRFNLCSADARQIINTPSYKTNEKIYVAVMDTGFDTQHPAYKDKLSIKYRFSTDHSVDVREIPEYRDGLFKLSHHGTHIVGILCGQMGKRPDDTYAFQGIAPHVKPILVQILPNSSDKEVVQAISYIKNTPAKIVSISMSFARPDQPIPYQIKKALLELALSGKILCIAAGNNGQYLESQIYTNTLIHLAKQAQGRIILVGATENNHITCMKTLKNILPFITERMAAFSNRPLTSQGREHFICAPGVGIRSTITHPFLDTMLLSGTSMATPIVAGALSWILIQNPNIDQARKTLFNIARKTYYESEKNLPAYFGNGIVDLKKLKI